MGLTAENITKASDTVEKLTADGVTFNVSADSKTLNTTGFYLILTGVVTGIVIALSNAIFRRFL